MKHCKKCNQELLDGAVFCMQCGHNQNEPVMVNCAGCGQELPETAVFCAKCGHKQGVPVPVQPPTTEPVVTPPAEAVQTTSEVENPKPQTQKAEQPRSVTPQAVTMPSTEQTTVSTKKPERKKIITIIACVLAVLIVGGGVLGFFALRSDRSADALVGAWIQTSGGLAGTIDIFNADGTATNIMSGTPRTFEWSVDTPGSVTFSFVDGSTEYSFSVRGDTLRLDGREFRRIADTSLVGTWLIINPDYNELAGFSSLDISFAQDAARNGNPDELDAMVEIFREILHEWIVEAFLDGQISSFDLVRSENIVMFSADGSGVYIDWGWDSGERFTWNSENRAVTISFDDGHRWTGTYLDIDRVDRAAESFVLFDGGERTTFVQLRDDTPVWDGAVSTREPMASRFVEPSNNSNGARFRVDFDGFLADKEDAVWEHEDGLFADGLSFITTRADYTVQEGAEGLSRGYMHSHLDGAVGTTVSVEQRSNQIQWIMIDVEYWILEEDVGIGFVRTQWLFTLAGLTGMSFEELSPLWDQFLDMGAGEAAIWENIRFMILDDFDDVLIFSIAAVSDSAIAQMTVPVRELTLDGAIEDTTGGQEVDALRAAHILVNDSALAQRLHQELMGLSGEAQRVRFWEMVRAYGEDPGMETHPDGYTFALDVMVPEFTAGTQALAFYEISAPIRSEFGYHIILRLPIPAGAEVMLRDGSTTIATGDSVTPPALQGVNIADLLGANFDEVRHLFGNVVSESFFGLWPSTQFDTGVIINHDDWGEGDIIVFIIIDQESANFHYNGIDVTSTRDDVRARLGTPDNIHEGDPGRTTTVYEFWTMTTDGWVDQAVTIFFDINYRVETIHFGWHS